MSRDEDRGDAALGDDGATISGKALEAEFLRITGDPEAMAFFLWIANRIVRDHHKAEDLVQEALLITWRRIQERMECGEGKLRGFIRTVLYHLCIAKPPAPPPGPIPEEGSPDPKAVDPSDEASDRELAEIRLRCWTEALAELPDTLFEVLWLRHSGGQVRSNEEIAEILGITLGAVATRLCRANQEIARNPTLLLLHGGDLDPGRRFVENLHRGRYDPELIRKKLPDWRRLPMVLTKRYLYEIEQFLELCGIISKIPVDECEAWLRDVLPDEKGARAVHLKHFLDGRGKWQGNETVRRALKEAEEDLEKILLRSYLALLEAPWPSGARRVPFPGENP